MRILIKTRLEIFYVRLILEIWTILFSLLGLINFYKVDKFSSKFTKLNDLIDNIEIKHNLAWIEHREWRDPRKNWEVERGGRVDRGKKFKPSLTLLHLHSKILYHILIKKWVRSHA